MFIIFLIAILGIFNAGLSAGPLMKIHKENMGNLENVFVHVWAWFNICDFAYIPHGDPWAPNSSNVKSCKPEDITAGSIIFATPYGIEKFLKEVHPKIKNPYILLTSCYGPVLSISKYVNDPKIIAWFGQTNRDAITFEKFTIIPLGICSLPSLFYEKARLNEVFKQYRETPKTQFLYMNFTVAEGRAETEERRAVYNVFKDKPFCTKSGRKPFHDYVDETARFKFVVSPEGDMHDCYRHWESLLVGAIPVVHKSPLDAIFKDLPVVIVDDYQEATQELLDKKYEEIQHGTYDLRKLYLQYWVDKINSARADYFKQ